MLERSQFGNHPRILTIEDREREIAESQKHSEPNAATSPDNTTAALGHTGLSNGSHTTEIMGTVKPKLGEVLRQERLARFQ